MPGLARSLAVRLSAEMAGFRKEWRESGDEAQRAAEKIRQAGQKAGDAAKPISELETTVARTSARLKNHRADWDQVGSSMLRTGTVIAGAGLLMTKAAMDWESQWTGVLKTVEGTPQSLAKVESGLRGLAKTLPESHENIAAVAEAAGQLGVATGDVVDFTRVMVMLGDTTDLTADGAATSIAQLMNIMGTAPDKVDELASTLVYLGNRGASTESQILQMAQRIASAGETVGLSEANVLSLANAVASTGIEVEAGGSAISTVLIDMAKAVDGGGDKLDTFAKTAGMSAQDFRAAWEADPASALASFTEGLGRLDSEGQSAFQTLDQLGLSDVRVTRALLNMANSGDLLRSSLADGNAEWQRNQALVEEAGKRYDTAAARGEVAWNNIKDNAIDAGSAMLPVVSEISDVISALSGAFGSLPGPVKSSLGLLATFGGAGLLAVGGLMKMIGYVTDTRAALDALDVSTSRSSRGLAAVGRAAGVVAAAFAGLQLVGSFYDSGERDGVATYTKQLLEMSAGSAEAKKSLDSLFQVEGPGNAFIGETYADINGLNDAIAALDPGALESGLQGLQGLFTETRKEAAEKSFAQVDKALTGLLSSGGGDDAAARFKGISAAMRDQGMSAKEVARVFPEYTEAVQAAKNEQDKAAESAKDAAGGVQYMADALARTGLPAGEAEEAVRKLAESTKEAALSFGQSMAVIDEDSTLSSYISDLEAAAQAQADWADNMVKAAARGVDADVLAKLQEEGPAAAGVLDELANGSQNSIDKLNDLYGEMDNTASKMAELRAVVGDEILMQFDVKGDKDAVGKILDVVEATDLAPDQVETIMQALDFASDDIAAVLDGMRGLDGQSAKPSISVTGAAAAVGQAAIVRTAINNLPNFKNIEIRTTRSSVGGSIGGAAAAAIGGYTGMQIPPGFTGGGKVPGTAPANPTIDNVMAYGATTGAPLRVRSGEWIINERQSKANDPWLAAMNGGLVMDDLMADLASKIISGNAPGFADGGQYDAVSPAEYTRMRIRVRDLKRSVRERERYGKGKKKSRYVLRGLDRREAFQELSEAQSELTSQARVQRKIPRGQSYKTYNNRREAAADAAEKRRDAAEQLTDDRSSAKESYTGNADIQSFTSPASVSRGLTQAINDMATYTQLLIQLKKKGAAPWLLTQLQKEGPSRGSIGLARKYLADSNALKAVNAQAAQLDAVSGIYGQVTADPKWSSSKAWSGNLSSAQQRTINEGAKTVNLTVNPIPGMSDTQVVDMAGSKIMQAFR